MAEQSTHHCAGYVGALRPSVPHRMCHGCINFVGLYLADTEPPAKRGRDGVLRCELHRARPSTAPSAIALEPTA